MSFIGWHGDPCSRCVEEPELGRPVQRAQHHGMCLRHWAGATEAQRRDAVFCEGIEDDADVAWTTPEVDALQLLCEQILLLPLVDHPEERRAA